MEMRAQPMRMPELRQLLIIRVFPLARRRLGPERRPRRQRPAIRRMLLFIPQHLFRKLPLNRKIPPTHTLQILTEASRNPCPTNPSRRRTWRSFPCLPAPGCMSASAEASSDSSLACSGNRNRSHSIRLHPIRLHPMRTQGPRRITRLGPCFQPRQNTSIQ